MRELFSDYEPDYDALWQEYVELDEQAVFYATHEQEDYPMTEDHKPLPVSGYTPQSDAKVALVNGFKQDEERLLRKLDALARNTLVFPSTGPLEPGQWLNAEAGPDVDHRWVAIARSHFEQGYMALNRSIFQPQRIKLPEDDGNPPGRQTSPEVAALAGRYLGMGLSEFTYSMNLTDGYFRVDDAMDVLADLRKLAASALGQVNG
jgi:hypothetical protein